MKAITLSALAFAVLMGFALWAIGSEPARAPAEQAQPDVETTTPSPGAPAPVARETSIRSRLKSSISAATDNVLRRTRREATTKVSGWKARMERLITSLDTLRTTLPGDAGVGIYVSPQRHLVDITLQGTNDRSVRLQASPTGEGYEAEPLGDSIVESSHFSSLPRLLLWLRNVIGDHIADRRER